MNEEKVKGLCEEYVNLLNDMQEYKGMYKLDDMRRKLHFEICEELELEHDATIHVMSAGHKRGTDLYVALFDLKKDLEEKTFDQVVIEKIQETRAMWGNTNTFTIEASHEAFKELFFMQIKDMKDNTRFMLESTIAELDMRMKTVFGIGLL